MTQPTPRDDTPALTDRLHTPGAALLLLLSSPFLIAFGAFVTIAMRPFVSNVSSRGDAVLMAWVGLVLLVLGAVLLTAGIVVACVRPLLQQHLDLLERGRPADSPES